VVADITEKKKREEQVETVARELRHRLLNTFSIISALASRSWPEGHSDAKSDFQTRIAAIGKATELMFSRDDMLNRTVTLQQVVETITAPYRSTGDDPFVFEGPEADVTEHARPLAMAIHELSTNAVKYGALSVPQGRVSLNWSAGADGSLTIRWEEKFGPPVLQPSKAGFGTTLLKHMLFNPPHSVELDYAAVGLTCVVTLHGCGSNPNCLKK
jgi:two-component sensor histidine kinase